MNDVINKRINAEAVAKIFDRSVSHIYALAKGQVEGCATLPHDKVGKFYFFDEDKVREYAVKHNFQNHFPLREEEPIVVEPRSTALKVVRTRLVAPRADKIRLLSESGPKRDPNEIIKVQGCGLLVYNDNGSGVINSNQSSDGPDCFVSQKVMDKGIHYLNDGFEILHQLINRDGEITYEETLEKSVKRINDLNIYPRKGRFGLYYVISLTGFWKRT